VSSIKYYPLLNASILDPKQTCQVADSGPVLRGQNVTFTCSLTYYFKSSAGTEPNSRVKPNFGWIISGSTKLSKSTTPLADTLGETLQIDVQKSANGTEIPSYNCTSLFHFIFAFRHVVARNIVWWTCASEPAYTWCTYRYLKLL